MSDIGPGSQVFLLEEANERLRAQLKTEQEWVKQYREAYGQCAEKIERLRAEVERYKGQIR